MKKPLGNHPRKLSAIMAALLCGVLPVSGQDERQPIISRMQVVYSMVSHYNYLGDRIDFYNSYGSPLGSFNYAVPHLVYEPNVTLYNPYNTALQVDEKRVRLANPPLGFKFKKNNEYLRPEWVTGDTFLGLGRFQLENERTENIQKTFTMTLKGGSNDIPNGKITLLPGESITFQVRVEHSWTWGFETSQGYAPRAFNDNHSQNNLTNVDFRTNNLFGAEAVARSPDFRAGFQTDHLSLSTGRPEATAYPFEWNKHMAYSWVAIKNTETVSVEAKGVRTVVIPDVPDFQLLLMQGVNQNVTSDTVRSYSFDMENLIRPGAVTEGVPDIGRTFVVRDILQSPGDRTLGGKTPFATFTIAAKASALRQGLFLAETQPPTNQLYQARIDSVNNFDETSAIGPSDGLMSGIEVVGAERVEDWLIIDVISEPGLPLFRLKGTTDPSIGFSDDITSFYRITLGPVGTGLFKVMVPVGERGDRYFVRIEK